MRTHKWEDIKARLDPEIVARAEREAEETIAAMELARLRKARRLTQEQLAERLGTRQAAVSKMERRMDMRISTLREVIEAMGGELRVTAHFPDAEYRLEAFEQVRD